MEQQGVASTSSSNANRDDGSLDDGEDFALQAKHKIFLSHSGSQKGFVEHLCVELEGCYRFPFFDKRRESLPIGEDFPRHIFDAIRQCDVGVVILSDEFITSKWPMMELVAMHERVLNEVEKGKSKFKVIPVFFKTSPKDLNDHAKCSEWLSCWQELAKKNRKRVEVGKWEAALKYLRKLNGVVYEGFGEVKFMKEIVDEICKVVPAEIKMEDSHIQGRSRICNIIRSKIDALRKDDIHGVCVLGLYGMGGIGKTSICKALCNDFFTKFYGKVCHAELERGSKEGLLREVLKSLTSTGSERLNEFNEDQLRNALKEGSIKDPVFLALDNMSDEDASIREVQTYLLGRLPAESIVIVTARSKDWLLRVRPFINESKCMQMPELMLDEAKSLFKKSCDVESRNDVDEKLILRCLERCYFQKEDGNGGFHYHPLALDVLGRQLSRLTDLKEWVILLDRIDEDIFNQSRENNHPIFSILRKSFDALSPGNQLLLMDVALYLPNDDSGFYGSAHSVFDWLRMVHNFQKVDDVTRALERLRAKSLLERVGDGFKKRIGMHDLWRAFCVAESQGGEMGRRRWVYDAVNCGSELVEASPSGSCWENVKRMAFLYVNPRSLEKVDFGHFANVTVLKIFVKLDMSKKVVINISRLIHLKSLEVWGSGLCDNLIIQGLPRSLLFLGYDSKSPSESPPTEQFVKQIACLEDLQFLCLIGYPGRRLPDMRSMVSLRVAKFHRCENAAKLTGLSSKLTNLQVLYMHRCMQLRSCPGVGDLVSLEELSCDGCERLERLPSLRKLRNLRKLDIRECDLITELPGLEDLVALEELHTSEPWWRHSRAPTLRLPDLSKLKNLRVLDLGDRRLQAVPGLDCLISLQILNADFREVLERPNLRQLPKLQKLVLRGCSLAELRATDDLAMLHTLDVGDCKGVDDLPDFQGPTNLRKLTLRDCEFKNATSLSELSTLEELAIIECTLSEVLPDLQGLMRLESLFVSDCDMLRGWDFPSGRGEESSCKRQDSNMQVDRGEFQRRIGLRRLELRRCSNFVDVTGIGAFSQLESLEIWDLPVRELPDLSNFPHLNKLDLRYCDFLTRLTSYFEPVPELRSLTIVGCNAVEYVPDLGILFPALEWLNILGCSGIVSLISSEPLTRMRFLLVRYCKGVSEGDVDQLRALCPPQCRVYFIPVVEEVCSDPVIFNSERRGRMRVPQLLKGCFRG
ncbi:hypothetical protein KC19_2G278800 [Ceratodon purpureus]|nr:hypothetical protein KC19_2G278800 [Ceratodon purpureus]